MPHKKGHLQSTQVATGGAVKYVVTISGCHTGGAREDIWLLWELNPGLHDCKASLLTTTAKNEKNIKKILFE